MPDEAPRFGPYELVRRLGAGGMAETFVAVRRGPGGFEQRVCLKRILGAFERDEEFVRLFLEEARLSARLRHANIAQVVDFGVVEGSHFLALELIEGLDLGALLAAQRAEGETLPAPLVSLLALELGTALDFAHDADATGRVRGVVHRDISPSNVLVSGAGEVKLTDFGIAKAVNQPGHTRTGIIKGKVPYMAPEYAREGHFDARSDLFALGVTLYECLAGERPFDGRTDLDTVQRIQEGRHIPLDDRCPNAPVVLSRAIERLLEPDPDHRFATAARFVDALVEVAPPPTARRALGELVRARRPDDAPAPSPTPSAAQEAFAPTAEVRGDEGSASPSTRAYGPPPSDGTVADALGPDGTLFHDAGDASPRSSKVTPASSDAATRTRLPDRPVPATRMGLGTTEAPEPGDAAPPDAAMGDATMGDAAMGDAAMKEPRSAGQRARPPEEGADTRRADSAARGSDPGTGTAPMGTPTQFERTLPGRGARRMTPGRGMAAALVMASVTAALVAAVALRDRPRSDESGAGEAQAEAAHGTTDAPPSPSGATAAPGPAQAASSQPAPPSSQRDARTGVDSDEQEAASAPQRAEAEGEPSGRGEPHPARPSRASPSSPSPKSPESSTDEAEPRATAQRRSGGRKTTGTSRRRPPRTARLEVVVLPFGDVWIDGRKVGSAPIQREVDPGVHTVATGEGQARKQRRVRVRGGQERTVVFRR